MEWIEPDWPAPRCVRALCTTRRGGVSGGGFADMNLADHVGDDPDAVAKNRYLLREHLDLRADPFWLHQVHGRCVAVAGRGARDCEADAVISDRPGEVCAVLTADCLPLLLCDRRGTRVGAVHAGWRGLADGVVEEAVVRLGVSPGELLCWLGPAIGQGAFEVGHEVRRHFLASGGIAAESAFRRSENGKWLADLYLLARQRLRVLGVDKVWGGGLCTYSDPERFFSYRRDGATGRMASLIWIRRGFQRRVVSA